MVGGWVVRGWEEEYDEMKPPDVKPLEAAARATLEAKIHRARTVICDDIMPQRWEQLQ